jgi:hypothetical protein
MPTGVSVTFPLSFDVTLNGQDQIATSSHVISVSDLTSGGRGWRLTVSATQFSTGGRTPYNLPSMALTVGQGSGPAFQGPRVVSASVDAGDAIPANAFGINGQLEVPAVPLEGAAPTPAVFFVAAAGTGQGTFEIEIPYSLRVPANAHAGQYATSVTITHVVGP